jgi:hypothetical protein
VCTIEQRQPAPSHRLRRMTTAYVNATIAALSIIAAGAAGLLAPVTTPSGWFVLAVAATASPLVLMHYWSRPTQTLSESIQKAIR